MAAEVTTPPVAEPSPDAAAPRQRDQEIDTVKTIAIFLVVFGHFVDTPIVAAYVYSFHMPLFFFVSGLLYEHKRSFREHAARKFRSLVVPYFLFSALYFAFFLLRKSYGDSPDPTKGAVEKLTDILTWHQFWFLGVLFVVSLAFHLLAPAVKSAGRLLATVAVCTLVHGLASAYFSASLHENVLKCFPGLVFYSCGYFVKGLVRRREVREFIDYHPLGFIVIVAGNIALFLVAYRAYGMLTINSTENYLVSYGLALSGIFVVWVLATYVKSNRYTAFVGANTVLIYLMEGYPPAVTRRIMVALFSLDNFTSINFGYAVVYSIMTILLLTPFILMINRYVPWAIGRARA